MQTQPRNQTGLKRLQNGLAFPSFYFYHIYILGINSRWTNTGSSPSSRKSPNSESAQSFTESKASSSINRSPLAISSNSERSQVSFSSNPKMNGRYSGFSDTAHGGMVESDGGGLAGTKRGSGAISSSAKIVERTLATSVVSRTIWLTRSLSRTTGVAGGIGSPRGPGPARWGGDPRAP